MTDIHTLETADDLEGVITRTARRLDVLCIADRQIGIQFMQIGDDERATEELIRFDDTLYQDNNIRVSSQHHLVREVHSCCLCRTW
jgi:hypothetical protein